MQDLGSIVARGSNIYTSSNPLIDKNYGLIIQILENENSFKKDQRPQKLEQMKVFLHQIISEANKQTQLQLSKDTYIKELESDSSENEKKIQEILRNHQLLLEKYTQLQTETKNLKSTSTRLQNKVDQTEQLNHQLKAETVQISQKCQNLQTQNNFLETECSDLKTKNQALTNHASDLKSDYNDLSQVYDELKVENQELTIETKNLNHKFNTLETYCQQLGQQTQQLSTQLNQMTQQYTNLQTFLSLVLATQDKMHHSLDQQLTQNEESTEKTSQRNKTLGQYVWRILPEHIKAMYEVVDYFILQKK